LLVSIAMHVLFWASSSPKELAVRMDVHRAHSKRMQSTNIHGGGGKSCIPLWIFGKISTLRKERNMPIVNIKIFFWIILLPLILVRISVKI
jgi:hypothetical protein